MRREIRPNPTGTPSPYPDCTESGMFPRNIEGPPSHETCVGSRSLPGHQRGTLMTQSSRSAMQSEASVLHRREAHIGSGRISHSRTSPSCTNLSLQTGNDKARLCPGRHPATEGWQGAGSAVSCTSRSLSPRGQDVNTRGGRWRQERSCQHKSCGGKALRLRFPHRRGQGERRRI